MLELVNQNTHHPALAAQEMVCATQAVAIVEALSRGATRLTVHADGDVKTDLGGWEDDTDNGEGHRFTSSTIRSEPVSGSEVARVLGEVALLLLRHHQREIDPEV